MFNPKEHMMVLKGKEYLQVAWRLVWFREDHPDWSIDANCVEQDENHAIFKAIVADENGIQKSSGHGSESKRDFGDFLEKAETKAVGRALAMLGYGTQFAGEELDEGERIVDSPIAPKQPATNAKQKAEPAPDPVRRPPMPGKLLLCEKCGNALTNYTKKDGTVVTIDEIAQKSRDITKGKLYCLDCLKAYFKGTNGAGTSLN